MFLLGENLPVGSVVAKKIRSNGEKVITLIIADDEYLNVTVFKMTDDSSDDQTDMHTFSIVTISFWNRPSHYHNFK